MKQIFLFYAYSPTLNQLVTNKEFKTTALGLQDWLQDLNDSAYRGVEDWSAQATPELGGIRLA
jgi:hypothetical protein